MKCSAKFLAVPAFAALMLVVAPFAMTAPASADVGVNDTACRSTIEVVGGVSMIVSNTADCCSRFLLGWDGHRWLGWDGSTWFARDRDRWVGWNGDHWLEGDGHHWFAWGGNHWLRGTSSMTNARTLTSFSDLIGGSPVIPVIPVG